MSVNNVNLETLKVTHAAELFDLFQAEAIYSYIPEKPPFTLAELENRYQFIILPPTKHYAGRGSRPSSMKSSI